MKPLAPVVEVTTTLWEGRAVNRLPNWSTCWRLFVTTPPATLPADRPPPDNGDRLTGRGASPSAGSLPDAIHPIVSPPATLLFW